MKYILAIILLSTGCASNNKFFGGRIRSPIVYKFGGNVECAMIEGWSSKIKCFCKMRKHEEIGPHVTFLAMQESNCNNDESIQGVK